MRRATSHFVNSECPYADDLKITMDIEAAKLELDKPSGLDISNASLGDFNALTHKPKDGEIFLLKSVKTGQLASINDMYWFELATYRKLYAKFSFLEYLQQRCTDKGFKPFLHGPIYLLKQKLSQFSNNNEDEEEEPASKKQKLSACE
jgi:hypothetical protein